VTALAVTVIGDDRPGIIAAVTAALADVGGNIEDSSMTILRGRFAMTLIVDAPADAATTHAVVEPVAARLGLIATVAEVGPETAAAPAGAHVVLSVHGADHPGIVSALTAVVAGHGGNITDLTTRLAGDLYVVVADIDLRDLADVPALDADIRIVADELGVDAVLRPADPDVL
jgi:glycine cleavage system transcriptional repressor